MMASEFGSASNHGRSPRWSERRSSRESRPSVSRASTAAATKLLPNARRQHWRSRRHGANRPRHRARPVAAVTTVPSGRAIAAVAPPKAVPARGPPRAPKPAGPPARPLAPQRRQGRARRREGGPTTHVSTPAGCLRDAACGRDDLGRGAVAVEHRVAVPPDDDHGHADEEDRVPGLRIGGQNGLISCQWNSIGQSRLPRALLKIGRDQHRERDVLPMKKGRKFHSA